MFDGREGSISSLAGWLSIVMFLLGNVGSEFRVSIFLIFEKPGEVTT
jgi:hypothetical protein